MASLAIAFATNVLPVPGGPSNRTPRRAEPPIVSRKVWCARKRLTERTTSALMESIPTRSSKPTAVSPGRISVCGERPAPMKGASMTAPSIRTMMMMGNAPPSQCGTWTAGKMLCPLTRRMTTQPMTSAQTATNRRRRAIRWRSRVRATSALPRMESPTMPDIASVGLLLRPSPESPGSGFTSSLGWRLGWRPAEPGRVAPGITSADRLITRLRSSPVDVSNVENPTGSTALRSDESHK